MSEEECRAATNNLSFIVNLMITFWLCRVIVWSMKCQRKAVSTNHNHAEDDCDCDAFFFPETVQNSKISNLQLCKNTAEVAGNPPTGEAGTCLEHFCLQKWLWLFIKSQLNYRQINPSVEWTLCEAERRVRPSLRKPQQSSWPNADDVTAVCELSFKRQ